MCRINGILSKNFIPDQLITFSETMSNSMKRGGPDGHGTWSNSSGNLVLGHRRLSIIDLSDAGAQPMEDENSVIIFNGEIYDYQILRTRLIGLGHIFKSHSDTEVILKAYTEWGTSCFQMFNGIFAFSLFDKKTNQLLLVRNSNSVKPIYYFSNENIFVFASEIRAFLDLPFNWKENENWKIQFLLFGHIPEPFSILKDVYMLKKGQYLRINIDSNHFTKHEFNYKSDYTGTESSAALDSKSKIKESLCNAVQRQLISDAPYGIFLSGGIDSSIIALCAHKNKDLHPITLSLNFEETAFSEKSFQKLIVKKIESKHFEKNITYSDFENSFDDIIDSLDQPSVDGINTYFISKFASEVGLKAVLSGLGADEYFGGYPSFNPNSVISNIWKFPKVCSSLSKLSSDLRIKKLEFLQIDDLIGQYLMLRGNYPPSVISKILNISEIEVFDIINQLKIDSELIGCKTHFAKVSWFETNLYMKNQLLRDTDFMGMWNSVEIRVPFLDDEFLTTINKIPDSEMWNGNPKGILINAFKDELPEAIWNRPKMGFTFPFQIWMKNHFIHSEIKNESNPYFKKLAQLFLGDKLHWSRFWSLYLIGVFEKKLTKKNYTDLYNIY
ncbi:MAG: asparagine synthase (glutamine-hydrolyzing) [Bacteroidota bacterium]|nr:asparagine synthase (glutamine-hydrolyzing) [Bacteroidota bacterium]